MDASDDEASPPTLTVRAGLATIRLRRPRHHNRLETPDIAVLGEHLAAVEGDASVRALVLSAGGRSFCAGFDLARLGQDMPPEMEAAGIGALASVVDALERCRVPTIAALQGPVFGGGTDLALACDFRVGVAGIRMFMPAGRFGLHYYHSGLRRYVERLGLGAAKRLFLLGETFDAAEMLRVGYLDELVADLPALEARVGELAVRLLDAASAEVVESMKRVLGQIASGDLDPAHADAWWARTRTSPAVGAAVKKARSPGAS